MKGILDAAGAVLTVHAIYLQLKCIWVAFGIDMARATPLLPDGLGTSALATTASAAPNAHRLPSEDKNREC